VKFIEMKKCIVCSKVKGKRVCKTNTNSLVCPSCCAQIRNPDCEGCRYYGQAEQYADNKAKKSGFKEFVAQIDPEVDEMVDHALQMVERGEISTGEKIISNLYKEHDDLYIVQYAMGTVFAVKGQYDKAIECFDKALDIFPYFVEAWFNKGSAHQKKQEVGETIRAYQKVIELGDPVADPVSTAKDFVKDIEKEIHRGTGLTLDSYLKTMDTFNEAFGAMEKMEWEKALTGFHEVVTVNPMHLQSYGNMGICYARLGRKQEGLAAFDKALDLDPNYEPALLNREIVNSLEDGEKLSGYQSKSMDYYKDYSIKKKSLLREVFKGF